MHTSIYKKNAIWIYFPAPLLDVQDSIFQQQPVLTAFENKTKRFKNKIKKKNQLIKIPIRLPFQTDSGKNI